MPLEQQAQNYSAGTLIIKENDRSRKMFIIKSGKVRVFKNYMGHKVTLCVLSDGEIFGELSFFDAEPRSASVEALTDVNLIIIDGDKNISGMPTWVLPIFKVIVKRFREADQKIAVLQSMYDFQKKGYKFDKLAQTVYLELLRFIKTFKLVYQEYISSSKELTEKNLFAEVEAMLGECKIPFKIFAKQMRESDFLKGTQKLECDIEQLDDLRSYIEKQIETEKYFILSYTSINILNHLIKVQHC